MNNRPLIASLALMTTALAGCSHSSSSSTPSSTSTSPSSSQATIDGTPQSAWPTTASSTAMPSPTGSASSTFAHHPNAAQSALPKQFMDAYFHTDGQSQDAWAKTMISLTQPQFGGRLSIQGFERLPHHQKVTGTPQLTWVSDDQPEAEWFVPTSDGGYTLSEDLSVPTGKIYDMQPGKNTPTDPD